MIEIRRATDGSNRRQLVVTFGKYRGASISVQHDMAGTRWLCAVIWYRRAPNRLGYLYPSLRLWGRS